MTLPAAAPGKGLFVVFEGGEGAGKTTQLAALADTLRQQGHTVTCTREPGGSPRAEQIRQLLLASGSDTLDPRAEALLFAAARAEHAAQVLRPALAAGQVVLSDRYIDSSIAYQGVARGLGADRIRQISLWATHGLRPHLTVVLDVDPAVGLARVNDPNRLEGESAQFHESVRRAFLDLAAAQPDAYLVLSATRDPADVAAAIAARVAALTDPALRRVGQVAP